MDCHEFTSMLDHLERETLMPAGVRGEALQHAENCARCRARLAAARLLSLELRALARDDQKWQAPAAVESVLLSAFREQSRPRIGIWKGLAWASAAAALVLGAWLITAHTRRSAPLSPASLQAAQPARAPQPPSVAPDLKRRQEAVAQPSPRRRFRAARDAAAAGSAGDFIALSPWATSYPVGEGMVLRVQLPRSAPALVGLPLGGGDMSGTVTADVVLGQDGVARAIRFLPPGQNGAANHGSGFSQN